jgi:hypothetical protein
MVEGTKRRIQLTKGFGSDAYLQKATKRTKRPIFESPDVVSYNKGQFASFLEMVVIGSGQLIASFGSL